MPKLLLLSSKEILEKQFPKNPRGYDPELVDAFLDQIIHDYRIIEANSLLTQREHDDLKKKIETLKKENNELSIELARYKNKFENLENEKNVSLNNIELIKTIRKYERYLWNIGVNPRTVK